MQSADEPTDGAARRSSKSPISVALLAAIACVPIVVAAGFLTDRPAADGPQAAVPGDISPLALRGPFDATADKRPNLPLSAGY